MEPLLYSHKYSVLTLKSVYCVWIGQYTRTPHIQSRYDQLQQLWTFSSEITSQLDNYLERMNYLVTQLGAWITIARLDAIAIYFFRWTNFAAQTMPQPADSYKKWHNNACGDHYLCLLSLLSIATIVVYACYSTSIKLIFLE